MWRLGDRKKSNIPFFLERIKISNFLNYIKQYTNYNNLIITLNNKILKTQFTTLTKSFIYKTKQQKNHTKN